MTSHLISRRRKARLWDWRGGAWEVRGWRKPRLPYICVFVGLGWAVASLATVRFVETADQLRRVSRELTHGDTVRIAPGVYRGGLYTRGVSNLTITATDVSRRPVIEGGDTGWHFSRCPGLVLRDLDFRGQQVNGLNIDDGGPGNPLVERTWIERVQVREVRGGGNHDGMKLSGLRDVVIQACVVEGWGGQAVDLVGCHDVVVTNCRLIGHATDRPSAGIQIKGGSSRVVVDRCRFTHAGERPLNIGGSTGRIFFRPADATWEAREVTVRNCWIDGGICAVAFVGVDGAVFEGNVVLFPRRWIIRILQETEAPEFLRCRNVVVRDNWIVFRRADLREEVNVGPRTAPESFRFERNWWFAEDQPERSRPRLPVEEQEGVYGRDPRADLQRRELRVHSQ